MAMIVRVGEQKVGANSEWSNIFEIETVTRLKSGLEP